VSEAIEDAEGQGGVPKYLHNEPLLTIIVARLYALQVLLHTLTPEVADIGSDGFIFAQSVVVASNGNWNWMGKSCERLIDPLAT
jgi:hypothetical protein